MWFMKSYLVFSMDRETVPERRATFYGPYREVNYKEICTKDSVKDALVNGEYGGDSSLAWLTSTKESYKGENKQDEVESQQSRSETNFVLGFDTVGYLTTNQDYKSHDASEKPNRILADQETHIADFCPGYTDQKKTEPSEYQVKFTLDADLPRPIPKTLKERRKYTNDLRETHFQLGSFKNPNFSETRHSFGEAVHTCADGRHESSALLETYKSRVFRAGDWNGKDRKSVGKSVTRKDFDVPRLEAYKQCDDNFVPEPDYHQATHFELGSFDSKSNSLYQKDFAMPTKMKIRRAVLVTQPPPSELFPCDNDTNFISTQERTYKDNGRDNILSLVKARRTVLEENKNRHVQSSVPISFKQEKLPALSAKFMSITTSDYHTPLHFAEEQKAPAKYEYNHISSNYNGKETKMSEAKACYVSHQYTSSQVRNECRNRRQDNKSTHFVFGTDSLDEKKSEHSSQFRKPLPVDPALKSAGKSLPQKKIYSHITPLQTTSRLASANSVANEKISVGNNFPISVMKQDYESKKNREWKNENLAKVESPLPASVATHFFHIDNDFQGTQNSTTQTDFVSPNLMPCSAHLPEVEV